MTTSSELIRFFHAEATEYLDAIEAFVNSDGTGPDAGAFVSAARALRGSATMARVPRIADLALALVRIANGLRDGEVAWSAQLHEDLRGAARDLRLLAVSASDWSMADDQRALQRLGILRGHVPGETPRSSSAVPVAGTAPIFVALQSSAIATDLESFLEDASNRAILDDVLNRVRSLRGIAGVADHPPLGEVADTVERTLRQLPPDAAPSEADVSLFRAAADIFRRASTDLRTRGRLDTESPEIARFVVATQSGTAQSMDAESVVNIDDLFYSDGGPHVLERGKSPPSTPDRRFRDEAVTRAEHLRRLVADARHASDPLTREHDRRDLREHLHRLAAFASSYGAIQAASVFADAADDAQVLDPGMLDVLDAAAMTMLSATATIDDVEHQLAVLARARFTAPRLTPTPTPSAGANPSLAARPGTTTHQGMTPAPGATAEPRKAGGVSGEQLRQALRRGLDGLRGLEDAPLSAPAELEVHEIVPIETLLYRGPAALARAIEIRDRMRGREVVDTAALHELYDLLDLARAD